VFFEWFDAVGVQDLPAVFAGESSTASTFDHEPIRAPPVMCGEVTPVADLDALNARVRAESAAFRASGVQRFWTFRAFDDPQEGADPGTGRRRTGRPALAARLDDAGRVAGRGRGGRLSAVFIGRFQQMMSIEPR
jgi:hypothetical protein